MHQLFLGNHDQSIPFVEKACKLSDEDSFSLGWLGCAYGMAGRTEDAERISKQLSDRAKTEYVAPSFFAWIAGGAGEFDKAFQWLERGFTGRDPLMAWLFLPTLDPLRSDERFDELLRRMKLR